MTIYNADTLNITNASLLTFLLRWYVIICFIIWAVTCLGFLMPQICYWNDVKKTKSAIEKELRIYPESHTTFKLSLPKQIFWHSVIRLAFPLLQSSMVLSWSHCSQSPYSPFRKLQKRLILQVCERMLPHLLSSEHWSTV